MIPPEHWDLIVVLDLAIFALPFLTSIYFVLDYKSHKLIVMRNYLRRTSGIRYFNIRLIVFAIAINCTCFWFVLFAPIEIPAPNGLFSLTNLMADYGAGVLFYSLCGSLLPYGLTFTLVIVSVLVN